MGTKFSKSTDKEHTIKLESSILYATWSANDVHAGSEALIEVKTMFVGEGSKISIVGKSEKGKKLGKIKDKIYGNGFSGKLTIPDKIKPGDMAYFKVELSGLGVSAESNRVPIRPKIEVSNMKWDKQQARRGDTLKLSADIEGVQDKSEAKVIIYEHDQDGNHDRIAEIPTNVKNKKIEVQWEYEYHEDTDEIPSDEEMKKYGKSYNPPEYFFTLKIDDQEYGIEQESGLLLFKDWVEIYLEDETGKPLANEKYELNLSDGSKREGTLDSDGFAREEDIPPGKISYTFPDLKDSSLYDTDDE